MGRQLNKLSALAVSRAKTPGYRPDGGGLYLQVSAGGAKSWVYAYMLRGRNREMGLGTLEATPLAQARALAAICRQQRAAGVDPIEARERRLEETALEAARAVTFGECATNYIEAHRAGWRNAKHAAQWEATLATYAKPVLGSLAVQSIDTALVLKVIEPIWPAKPETAGRVRGRIEAVLDWAAARGYRQGENPARWRGHLDKLLPKRSKVRRVLHHPALSYAKIGSFMAELRTEKGIGARALELCILTACRTSEAIGAVWAEVNLADRVWVIPGERIKAGKEHRIPLSPASLAVLAKIRPLAAAKNGEPDPAAPVFPGFRVGRPLSNMALLAVLDRMGRDDITVHGFRSTFRTWTAERTNFPNHVAEMALAHAISDDVEASYQRGDLFEKRRQLMNAWARFCATLPQDSGAVVALTG
jgi:integrase